MVEIDTTVFELKKKILLEKIGELVKLEMISRAPIEQGKLRASIESRMDDDGVLIGTNGIPYASYVEYGTWNMVFAHGEHGVYLIDGKSSFDQSTFDAVNIVDTWRALEDRNEGGTGQVLPFMRTAAFFSEEPIKELFKEAFR